MTSDELDEGKPARYTLDEVRDAFEAALAWVKQGLASAHGAECDGHSEVERLLDHVAELAYYTLALRPSERKP